MEAKKNFLPAAGTYVVVNYVELGNGRLIGETWCRIEPFQALIQFLLIFPKECWQSSVGIYLGFFSAFQYFSPFD